MAGEEGVVGKCSRTALDLAFGMLFGLLCPGTAAHEEGTLSSGDASGGCSSDTHVNAQLLQHTSPSPEPRDVVQALRTDICITFSPTAGFPLGGR